MFAFTRFIVSPDPLSRVLCLYVSAFVHKRADLSNKKIHFINTTEEKKKIRKEKTGGV